MRPANPLTLDLRSASALAPLGFFPAIADGTITPRKGSVAGLTKEGVTLADGSLIPCDVVISCTGSATPSFPYLSPEHRALLESEPDGPQLFRHLVHPRIPRMGFAGFNHCFMHVPAVEAGTLWLSALFNGELTLPQTAEAEASMARIRDWKRQRVRFEPSRNCGVNTRFQQYIDILLKDLGISPYRKLPNAPAELFGRYTARDYAGICESYGSSGSAGGRRPIAVDS